MWPDEENNVGWHIPGHMDRGWCAWLSFLVQENGSTICLQSNLLVLCSTFLKHNSEEILFLPIKYQRWTLGCRNDRWPPKGNKIPSLLIHRYTWTKHLFCGKSAYEEVFKHNNQVKRLIPLSLFLTCTHTHTSFPSFLSFPFSHINFVFFLFVWFWYVKVNRSYNEPLFCFLSQFPFHPSKGYLSFTLFLLCSVAQSCPTVCDHMDYSWPGSFVHGIPRQEHWSGLLFPLGDLPNSGIESVSLVPQALVDSLPLVPPGKPFPLL